MLVEETQVPLAALPVEALKDHLRLGTGFAEDSLQDSVLESFLRAAIAAIEARTGKMLIARDFSWKLSAWRDGFAQVLPVAPVRVVTEVAIADRAGDIEVVDPDRYVLEQDMQSPKLVAVSGGLPHIPAYGSVNVSFEAGLGAGWDELPADLAQAVLMLAAHYYENRDDVSLGQGCMPFGVTSLIERYRAVRLYAGRG